MIYRSPFADVAIPDVSLTEYVLGQAAAHADKPALIDGPSGRTYTYGQLVEAVRRVAAGLAQRGLKRGEVFAICSPNLPEYAIIFHAVASLGAINTPINPLYTVEELVKQLQDSGAQYLITVPAFLDKALAAAQATGLREVFVFGDAPGATPFADLLQNDGAVPPVTIDPAHDLVVLPYSSGTTGISKGVMLTHRNLVANICQTRGVQDAVMVTGDDVLLGLLPMFHIYGMVVVMNLGLVLGCTIITMPRFDLEQMLQLIQQHRISYMHLVPPIVLGLTKHPLVSQVDLSSLRCVVSAAAPLGGAQQQACSERLKCIVTQGYGMTEASPVTHFATRPREKAGAVGPVVPNTEGMVVDVLTQQPLGPNQEGEVWVRGPQVMAGYLNNPQATRQTVDGDGWLHTGDIGRADEEGHFTIVDRLKELIKVKGFQVAPAELEALLLTHPAVADCAVIGIPDEEAGEVPKAFVVRRGETSAEEIGAFVAEHVASYKRVRYFEFIDQIPKSASGKILRRMLVESPRVDS
jgi:acyl-CoA synthetase (AMP-forming)/AMP-acid ligase II